MPRGYIVLSFDCDIPNVKAKLVERGYDVSFLDAEPGWFGCSQGKVRLVIHPASGGEWCENGSREVRRGPQHE